MQNITYNSNSSTEESDYMPDEFVISFSEEGEMELQSINNSKKEEEFTSEVDQLSKKKRKVLKKRGRKRNSLRRSFTLLEGDDIYFNGFNPDYILQANVCKKNLEPLDTNSNHCICGGVDRITNEKVSIKIIDMKDERLFTNARKELMILKSIGGKNNIVNVKASFQENQLLHIVQYFPSETLHQRLSKQGSFNDQRVKSVLRQLLESIYVVHKNGIVHGNISSHNVIFKFLDQDEIYISDFMDSVYLCSINGNSYQMKTLPSLFSSPEVLSSLQIPKDHLEKVDTWSLGVILYQSIYGRYPFSSFEEVMTKDITSSLTHPESRNFIASCLNKDFVKRPYISDLSRDPWIN